MSFKEKVSRFASIGLIVSALLLVLFLVLDQILSKEEEKEPYREAGLSAPLSRLEFEFRKTVNPSTGTIPRDIRKKELAFLKQLKGNLKQHKSNKFTFNQLGPRNVGGRTRAAAFDISADSTILAGAVSGGMWKSTDLGKTWYKTTTSQQHHSVTCLVQDTRSGKTQHWYYGSGEAFGNSASRSFSANYLGNGIYHSADGGETWQALTSTQTNSPQTQNNWDLIWNIDLDESNTTQTELYAAIDGSVQRSGDGGATWSRAVGTASGNLATFTDVEVTSTGVVYATISSDGSGATGVFRSDDGITFTNLTSYSPFPNNHNRMIIEVDPNNENVVYFFGNTPGSGQYSKVFFGGDNWNSLFRYTYKSGDGSGSGGKWEDLSYVIPDTLGDFGNFNAQGSYNLVLEVMPGDSNTVFFGGTNLYRSTDRLQNKANVAWVGGYEPFTKLPFFEIYENHHPDQHVVAFHPTIANLVLSGNDGGLALTDNPFANSIEWDDLNNGYHTTQFYTVGIDQHTVGRKDVIGGMQDNGTYMTFSDNPSEDWFMAETGDGSFCYLHSDGKTVYTSRQRGLIFKQEFDAQGNSLGYTRIDPIGPSDYLFINPFVVDPSDEDILYMVTFSSIWRNDQLSQLPLNNQTDSINQGWFRFTQPLPNGVSPTCITATYSNPAHRIYVGTNNKTILRYDNANTGNPQWVDITANIKSGGYTSDIAVDPNDGNKALVVYSNYGIYSLYYTDNGGDSWRKVAGNLEDTLPTGTPPILDGLGTGPSCRTAAIIPTADGNTYLLGTSVGLFAADNLNGDSTIWLPQGENSIGNVVVDMIRSRPDDGFTAIGTHGQGVFTSYISTNEGVTKREEFSAFSPEVRLFPNPSSGSVQVQGISKSKVAIKLYSVSGKVLLEKERYSPNLPLDINHLPSGTYFLTIFDGENQHVKKLLLKQ